MVDGFNDSSVLSWAVQSYQNESLNWSRSKWTLRLCLISQFLFVSYFWRIGVLTLPMTSSTTTTTNSRNFKNDTNVEMNNVHKKLYNCNGDRWGNHLRLHPNQYLCAHGDHYYFGVTENGSLVWIDSKENVSQTWMQGSPGSSFSVQDNGTLVLENRKTGHITSHHAKQKFQNIHWTERCLRKFDCPYLHFHSDGVMVLNWIDDDGGWIEKNVKKIYDGFDFLKD